mmetsp:Transcript_18598/g.42988  ORF Transcript_18598/g.42988 Transcript_18598/m.42988 type:complete len:350 (+) Transcript_18598:403-1452(+)
MYRNSAETTSPDKPPSRRCRRKRRRKDIGGSLMMRSYTRTVCTATRCQLYMRSMRRWASHGSRAFPPSSRRIASRTPRTSESTSGSHKTIMSGSRTSGTPPTFVETTSSPQLAASSMAMQKDSVSEQFRKTWHRRRTPATSLCGTAPRKVTRSCRRSRSTISWRFSSLLPSPPTMKSTWGRRAQTFGMIPTNRSTPFRYTNRDTTPTLIRSPSPRAASGSDAGVNFDGSTAFGMTSILPGSSLARRIRLSRQACETQMAAFSVAPRVVSSTRFRTTPARSSNWKSEWSVKTLGSPRAAAYTTLSLVMTLVAWCVWTISMRSRIMMLRQSGKVAVSVGRMSWSVIGMNGQ